MLGRSFPDSKPESLKLLPAHPVVVVAAQVLVFHVPADELPAVRAALDGYARYQHLTHQYADLVIAETRQNLAASKKKKSSAASSWPKTRQSSN
jgi:hypothetical protein